MVVASSRSRLEARDWCDADPAIKAFKRCARVRRHGIGIEGWGGRRSQARFFPLRTECRFDTLGDIQYPLIFEPFVFTSGIKRADWRGVRIVTIPIDIGVGKDKAIAQPSVKQGDVEARIANKLSSLGIFTRVRKVERRWRVAVEDVLRLRIQS